MWRHPFEQLIETSFDKLEMEMLAEIRAARDIAMKKVDQAIEVDKEVKRMIRALQRGDGDV